MNEKAEGIVEAIITNRSALRNSQRVKACRDKKPKGPKPPKAGARSPKQKAQPPKPATSPPQVRSPPPQAKKISSPQATTKKRSPSPPAKQKVKKQEQPASSSQPSEQVPTSAAWNFKTRTASATFGGKTYEAQIGDLIQAEPKLGDKSPAFAPMNFFSHTTSVVRCRVVPCVCQLMPNTKKPHTESRRRDLRAHHGALGKWGIVSTPSAQRRIERPPNNSDLAPPSFGSSVGITTNTGKLYK
jgi:hypothetical protein